jgi:hypothetical protein
MPPSAVMMSPSSLPGSGGFAQLLGLLPGSPQNGSPAAALAGAGIPTGDMTLPGDPDGDLMSQHTLSFYALGLFARGQGAGMNALGATDSDAASAPPPQSGADLRDTLAVQHRGVEAHGGELGSGPHAADRSDRAVTTLSAPTSRHALSTAPSLTIRLASPQRTLITDPAPEAPASRSAPIRQAETATSPTSASLLVSVSGERLSIVAAVAHLNPAEYARLRARLAEVAASLGSHLDGFQINGHIETVSPLKGFHHGP